VTGNIVESSPALTNEFDSASSDPAYADMRYRDLFWPSRRYEDRCDRMGLRALLPTRGDRLVELGAGFGRLANEYAGYRHVALLDLSGVQLDAARERLRDDPRFEIVEGDIFHLPFEDATFDTVVCIRVIHHFEDPRPAIAEMARILKPGGVLVLEAANKRNLKAILLYALRRQMESPFTRGSAPATSGYFLPENVRQKAQRGPDEQTPKREWTATTDYDHAPADVRRWLRANGLELERTRSVSNLRVPWLTRRVPLRGLVALERLTQRPFAPVTLGPEIFYRATKRR
jgi:ubiquinone/menaquinone biosynthesis C-methylase UbiE